MTEMRYDDLTERIPAEALQLFREMVDSHLSATGDRLFMRSDTFAGTRLLFAGRDASKDCWEDIDTACLNDLARYGLLDSTYSDRGTPQYRVTSEAQRYYRWLMDRQGEPIEQVDSEVQRFLIGGQFAEAHSSAAHHLGEAFHLVWDGVQSDQTISEIGDHLRKALMDVTSDLVGEGAGGRTEQPIGRLQTWLAGQTLGERDLAVLTSLVELADSSLRLDHGLAHIRDEADKGRSRPTWDEVRRAAFVTAFVCYELGRLS